LLLASAHAGAVTITVTSADDSTSHTPCNLRNAITAINYGNTVLFPGCHATAVGLFGDNDTVMFAASLANSTITLAQGEISNYAPLTISGSGQTIDAGNTSRVLSTIAYLGLKNLTLTHGNFSGNGGALYANQAFVSLDHVHLGASRAAAGAGLAVVNGSAALAYTVIDANTAANGAGIFGSAMGATLTNSTVSDNTATCSGACGAGIALVNGSNLTLSGSTLARNVASSSGANAAGALYASGSKVTAVNSTISANSASGSNAIAGAILENQPTGTPTMGVWLTNTTLSANSGAATSAAALVSGGILLGPTDTGQLAMANTILAGNNASASGNLTATADFAGNGTATADHSLLGNAMAAAQTGNGNVFADVPGLAALGNYGGATQTSALLGSSPAVDSGSNANALSAQSQPLANDQRGHARIVNATVDIGAYEFPGDRIFGDNFGS